MYAPIGDSFKRPVQVKGVMVCTNGKKERARQIQKLRKRIRAVYEDGEIRVKLPYHDTTLKPH
jgi:hypothetical protein